MLNAGPWIVFELAINFFQSFLYMYYPWKVLGQKDRFSGIFPFLICILVQFIQLTFFNIITLFEGYGVFVSYTWLFISALIFLEGTIIKKIIVSSIPIILNALTSIGTLQLFVFISDSSSYDLLNYNYPSRFYIVFVVNIFFCITTMLAGKLSKHFFNVFNQKEWKHFALITLICIISFTSLVIILLELEKTDLNIYIYISMISVVATIFYIFSIIKDINQKHKIETENELLRQQFFLQKKNIENIRTQYETLRKVRHDFNNTLCIIRNLNSNNSREQIEEYVSSYIKSTATMTSVINTKNDFVNAIINSKFSEASEAGIEAIISISSEFDPIEPTDICNLLGNMFDNAIRSCKSYSGSPLIRLEITECDGETIILMKNSIESSVLTSNPNLISDKPDNTSHGFGTRIIKEIAERYHGFADFYEDNNMFCCSVTLYM